MVNTKKRCVSVPAEQLGTSIQDEWGYLVLTSQDHSKGTTPIEDMEDESSYLEQEVEVHDQTRAQNFQSATSAEEDCAAPDLQHSYFGFQGFIPEAWQQPSR